MPAHLRGNSPGCLQPHANLFCPSPLAQVASPPIVGSEVGIIILLDSRSHMPLYRYDCHLMPCMHACVNEEASMTIPFELHLNQTCHFQNHRHYSTSKASKFPPCPCPSHLADAAATVAKSPAAKAAASPKLSHGFAPELSLISEGRRPYIWRSADCGPCLHWTLPELDGSGRAG